MIAISVLLLAGPADSAPVVLNWMLTVDTDKPLWEQLAADFHQQHPDIDVHITWVATGQYQNKLKTLIAANQSPDLFYCSDVWVAYLLPALYDLTDFINRDTKEIDLDDFYPELLADCRHNGRYYYLPRWFNLALLYYNKKLFTEKGVAFPTANWTWDDYLKAAQQLPGTEITLGWWNEWLTFVRQAGGDLFSADLSHCTLDTPAAMTGLQFYRDHIWKYKIAPAPGYGPANGFASGKMAMLLGGHVLMWPVYNQIPGLDWDIQVLPAGPKSRRGGTMNVEAFGIAKTCRDPEAAWALLKFITSKAGIRRQVQAGHFSVRKSVTNELHSPANIRAVYDALRDAEPLPRSPDFLALALDVIQPEIDLMMENKQDVATTARRATDAANAFLRVLGQTGERH